MDGEENVRILAWRQENVILKKFADLLRGQGHLDDLVGYCTWPTPRCHSCYQAGLGSSTVDQVLNYTKNPKYLPSTSTGQVLIFF